MKEPIAWIIGDWQHADFAAALRWLNAQAPCRYFDHPSAAVARLARQAPQPPPRAFLFVQSRHGQLAATDVERLHAAAPLARLIALVGPWCEGEARSDRLWRGVVQVPWRVWQSRLPQALADADSGEALAAWLPRTASDVERVESSVAQIARAKRCAASALIRTSSQATYQAIAAALERLGVCSCSQFARSAAAIPAVDLIVCDGWEQVRSSEDREPCGPISPHRFLLLHFPRADDMDRAARLNIAAVLAQPLLLADVAVTLGRLGLPLQACPDRLALTAAAGRK